jgi:RNA polymerase sigma factor (sigma-70 family)
VKSDAARSNALTDRAASSFPLPSSFPLLVLISASSHFRFFHVVRGRRGHRPAQAPSAADARGGRPRRVRGIPPADNSSNRSRRPWRGGLRGPRARARAAFGKRCARPPLSWHYLVREAARRVGSRSMAEPASSTILQLIRRVLVDPRLKISPDQELLQRFLAEQDEVAFEAILRRHGPMVLDVCRGVLANEADAEDAFQATFLVLARKAGSIRKTATLASWLHGVAYRTALKARAEAARRRQHEAHVPEREVSDPDSLSWAEVRCVLQEELGRLSERHREPLVLCYLQGKTQDEAAPLLGLSKGTLRRRLERGRGLLRERLVRRGLGPAALLLASGWPAAMATAGVPQALVVSTVRAALLTATGTVATAGVVSARAAALSEGVLRAMCLTNVTGTAAVLVAVGLVGFGGSAVTYHTAAAQQAAARGDLAPQARQREAGPDLNNLASEQGDRKMKPFGPVLVALGAIGTSAVHEPNAATARPTPSGLVTTSEGVEDWNRRRIHYQLKGKENPTITFEKNRDACSIRTDTDGVRRHLFIRDDEILIDGRKFDTGSYSELSLSASRGFLVVRLVKTWSQSSSHSVKSSADNSSGNDLNSASSRSSTSSQSSRASSGKTLLVLGLVDFGAGIEFRFEGGDSIENRIHLDSGKCVIEFDIDQGKHKRRVVIEPSLIAIDNDERKTGENPKITLSATQKRASLRIRANGEDVWATNEVLAK